MNLGNDANGLRLLELARGEWCWFLGDDEPVEWSELGKLVDALAQETAGIVRVRGPGARFPEGMPRSFATVDELVRGLGSSLIDFQEASATIVRSSAARRCLRVAYRFTGRLHVGTPLQFEMLRGGATLSAEAVEGLCPACLLSMNLATQTDPGVEPGPGARHAQAAIPSPETVAKLFEVGPMAYTPGTKMPEQRIGSAEDRAALVTFLEKATKN